MSEFGDHVQNPFRNDGKLFNPIESSEIDQTLSLSDSLIFKIFEKLPESQSNDVSLVCKRWLNLQGRRLKTLKVLDFDFVLSGRISSRFPKLTHVDLVSFSLPKLDVRCVSREHDLLSENNITGIQLRTVNQNLLKIQGREYTS